MREKRVAFRKREDSAFFPSLSFNFREERPAPSPRHLLPYQNDITLEVKVHFPYQPHTSALTTPYYLDFFNLLLISFIRKYQFRYIYIYIYKYLYLMDISNISEIYRIYRRYIDGYFL